MVTSDDDDDGDKEVMKLANGKYGKPRRDRAGVGL